MINGQTVVHQIAVLDIHLWLDVVFQMTLIHVVSTSANKNVRYTLEEWFARVFLDINSIVKSIWLQANPRRPSLGQLSYAKILMTVRTITEIANKLRIRNSTFDSHKIRLKNHRVS